MEKTFDKSISVLIPWCDRDEIAITLAANHRFLNKADISVTLVCCGGDVNAITSILRKQRLLHCHLLVLPSPTFNKSLAINMGLTYSQSDLVFILDADIILKSDLLVSFSDLITLDSFATVDKVDESAISKHAWPSRLNSLRGQHAMNISSLVTTHTLHINWTDGTTTEIETFKNFLLEGGRSGPGLLMCNRQDLLSIGGFNSSLRLWGWEDHDVNIRLRCALGRRHFSHGVVLHLTHLDSRRNLQGNAREAALSENMLSSFGLYEKLDFNGSLQKDNLDWSERCTLIDCSA